MSAPKPVLVAAGGLAGAAVRWGSLELTDHATVALIVVNTVGAAILGFVVRRAGAARPRHHLLLGVGFCGSLTSFSTLALDAAVRLDDGQYAGMAILVLGSVVVGLVAARLGMAGAEPPP